MFSAKNKLVSLCFTGWRAERGDLCRPAAFYDCLFVLICAEEEGDNLRTRAGIVRHELAAVALYDFLSKRPVHRGKRVARNGIGVREAGHQLLQGDCLGRSVAEQKRDGLSAGAFAVTFTIYFFNLDMKLLSAFEPILLQHYDRIPRNQHL